jgi:hypothetical protein
MDYAAAFNGTLDEFRILDQAISGSVPPLLPEPSRLILVAGVIAASLALRQRA